MKSHIIYTLLIGLIASANNTHAMDNKTISENTKLKLYSAIRHNHSVTIKNIELKYPEIFHTSKGVNGFLEVGLRDAAYDGDCKVAQYFIEKGAQGTLKVNRMNALDVAIEQGNMKIVQMLVANNLCNQETALPQLIRCIKKNCSKL